MSRLPSFASFSLTVGDDTKYLRHIGTSISYEDDAGAVDPNTRFAIERADSGNLVHLRHCFTNRYLVRGESEPSFIKVEAAEVEEDQSVVGCTLFRPEVKNDNMVSFVHVQSGLRVCVLHTTSGPKRSYWVLAGESGAAPLETQYFNLDLTVILPKRVLFKGYNGRYLGHVNNPSPIGVRSVLRLDIEDATDPRAQFEVVQHKRGHTTIKCLDNGQFWYIYENWMPTKDDGVVSPGMNNNDNARTWFTTMNGPNGSICLRGVSGLHANKFCEGFPSHFAFNFFSCTATSMISKAQLEVQEPVATRIVYVNFRLDNARIFNGKPLVAFTDTIRNESDIDGPSTEVDVTYTKSRTSTWNNHIRAMFGIQTTFKTKLGFIVEGKIDTSAEVEYQHEWGGSQEESITVTSRPNVPVPAWKMATIMVFATEAECDIPFSYRQVDVHLDGQPYETELHDGVYHNVNNYDFHTIIRYAPIQRPENSENFEAQESPNTMSREEYERVVEIYKDKVKEARAGNLDLSTPTIVYG